MSVSKQIANPQFHWQVGQILPTAEVLLRLPHRAEAMGRPGVGAQEQVPRRGADLPSKRFVARFLGDTRAQGVGGATPATQCHAISLHFKRLGGAGSVLRVQFRAKG